jgi:hypothetical protein
MNSTTNDGRNPRKNGRVSPGATNGETTVPRRRKKRRRHIPARDTRPPIERVLPKLERVTQSSPGQWSALCPAHDDTNPSLSISEKSNGKVLLHCHAGCSIDDILIELCLTKADLFRSGTSLRNGHKSPPGQAAKNGDANGHTSREKSPVVAKSGNNQPNEPRREKKWERLTRKYAKALTKENLQLLADGLGLPPKALRALRVGWRETKSGGTFTFPEYDGRGRVIGINNRALSGDKWMVAGSHRGLYLPTGWLDRNGPILVAEGASCTAALTAMGLAGIGRPNAGGGAKQLAELIRDIPKKRMIIVLGENDAKPTGDWPGRDGAIVVTTELITTLGRPVRWALPPDGVKDVREWLQNQKGQ